MFLKVSVTANYIPAEDRYSTGELVRRLLALAWRFRGDCLWSLVLSVVLLLLGIAGLKLLGVVIDVIRYALDPVPAGAGVSVRLDAAGRLVAAAGGHGAGAGDCGAGAVAGGADLRLQHGHGAADAGGNRAGVARAALRQAAAAELQLLRSSTVPTPFSTG